MSKALNLSHILSPALAATLIASASLVTAQDSRDISGMLQYRERIALPDDAQIIIELRGWQDALIGETSFGSDGRQGPLPFTVQSPARLAARLRAGILTDGQPRWISDPVEIAAGDAPVDLGPILLRAFDPLLFASTYHCGTQDIRIGIQNDQAVMQADGQRYVLVETVTASGAKYVAEQDPTTYFWSKGAEAMVSLQGQELPTCTLVPPAPASYGAQGNEPGWTLTIRDGQITLVTGYGEHHRSAPLPPIELRGDAYVMMLEDPDLDIMVQQNLCHDSATGMPYPDRLTLTSDDGTLSGCGGDPRDLIRGGDWTVVTVAGSETDAQHAPTLQLGSDDRIAGSAGCNRYSAAFTLGGESLSIGPAVTALMACAPEVMSGERTFLDALSTVTRFDIDAATGMLQLIGAQDQVVITARR
ncbi:META domain-containing protein [Pseudodonghicola xiamenensis]|uniref:META domain-containing protein n=1 Tax=Pseudodonghicola xiamenensis TaxID=337702 RepID=UPI000A075B37|nr:META domain-containing protein [Pseudodonghicola xiamenensis]